MSYHSPRPLDYRPAVEGDLLVTRIRRQRGGIGLKSNLKKEAHLCIKIPPGTDLVITELPESFCEEHRLTGNEHPALLLVDEGRAMTEFVRFFETVRHVDLRDFPEGVRFKVGKILPCMQQ